MKANKRIMGLVLTAVMVITVVVMVGCAAAPAAPSTPSTPSAPSGPQTLKIGMNITLVWPIGIDCKHGVEFYQEKINNAGGLDIGGTKYKLDLIWDDNKMDEALSKTAFQKEIFQDGVKFVHSDMWNHSCYQLAEDNHVVFFTGPSDFTPLDPKWHYLWNPVVNLTDFPMVIAYAAKTHPDLKTFVGSYPDREDGRGYGKLHGDIATACGLKNFDPIYYPSTATDFSAVGTKIKQLNPDILSCHGGGPQYDTLVYKAAYAAGWKGLVLGPATIPAQTVVDIAGAEAVEGMISIAWPMEFDPVNVPISKEFKDYYIAKYGKYDNPEVVECSPFYALTAALQKAGSTDVEKVKAALDSGLAFTSINGNGVMIPRPDLNNPRTVNAIIYDLPIKTIKNGKPAVIDTLTKPMALGFLKTMFGITIQ